MKNKKKTIIVSILLVIITILSFGFVKLNPIVYKVESPKEKLIGNEFLYNSSQKYYAYTEEDLNYYKEIVSDENGVIQSLLYVKEDTYTYNMDKIAKYGLVMYSAYCEYNEKEYLEKAKIQADALIELQDKETGMYYNDYDLTLTNIDEIINDKWGTSAIQGEAISLISRMYNLTQEEKYKISCELALKTFEKETYNGGVVSYLDDSVFYDGYNFDYGLYNLSDFMESLIGLYDCYKNLNNEKSKELYDKGILTLKKCIQYYDKDNYILIDLSNQKKEIKANVNQNINYILQLQTINQIEKDSQFESIIEKWKTLYIGENK